MHRVGSDKNFNPRLTGSGATLQWVPESIVHASTSVAESAGTEFEAIINRSRNWRISVSVATNEVVKANVVAEEQAWVSKWKRNLDTLYNGAPLPGSRVPTSGQLGTFYSQFVVERFCPHPHRRCPVWHGLA